MRKGKKADAISTFLGTDARIEGTIEFQGSIRLDGKVKGKIHSREGTMIVGEKAVINADIAVEAAIIMGEVNGTIDAKNRIEVYPPARVVGDIQAPVVSIDAGVIFNGTCTMKARSIPTVETVKSEEKKTTAQAPKAK